MHHIKAGLAVLKYHEALVSDVAYAFVIKNESEEKKYGQFITI